MSAVKDSLTNFLTRILSYGYDTHKDLILGLIIGLVAAWLYHRFIGGRAVRISYERLIESKEQNISSLKMVVNERLAKVAVPQPDARWFKALRKFFS